MEKKKCDVDIRRFPPELEPFVRDAVFYDSSCSPEARVYDLSNGSFLKIAPAGTLRTEAEMTAYFHALGLSAEVLCYGGDGRSDYLVTERLPGEDCLARACLEQPERLCDTVAVLLRALHETDGRDCPVRDRLERYRADVERGFDRSAYEPELFSGLWSFESFEQARDAAREGLRSLQKDALIHGDYCLPNIVLRDWKLSGYIDLGRGGIADRHIDILWGVWTLCFNLGTARLSERFLDAYGRDRVEPEKLRCLAAMEIVGA